MIPSTISFPTCNTCIIPKPRLKETYISIIPSLSEPAGRLGSVPLQLFSVVVSKVRLAALAALNLREIDSGLVFHEHLGDINVIAGTVMLVEGLSKRQETLDIVLSRFTRVVNGAKQSLFDEPQQYYK